MGEICQLNLLIRNIAQPAFWKDSLIPMNNRPPRKQEEWSRGSGQTQKFSTLVWTRRNYGHNSEGQRENLGKTKYKACLVTGHRWLPLTASNPSYHKASMLCTWTMLLSSPYFEVMVKLCMITDPDHPKGQLLGSTPS